jgi:L-fucose mutarotase/ribose pyranase (RbsD/FucU family)
MEMDWESLLDELWSYAATDPSELETKIRLCLKGHSSEGLLQAISLLIAQGQDLPARTLLSEFLKNHQAAHEIQRRLEQTLYLKENRAPPVLSIKNKQRDKEALLREVNDLVASGELLAAESRLLSAIEAVEEPAYLDMLSRVFMLQRRPVDEARTLQRALLLRRQQQAFIETLPSESLSGDLPTDTDLEFLNDSAGLLYTLESQPKSGKNLLVDETADSINFIQRTASEYLPLSSDGWWEGQPVAPSPASILAAEIEKLDMTDASPTAAEGLSEKLEQGYKTLLPLPKKAILTLTRSMKTAEPSEEEASTVKVFKKSGRSLTIIPPKVLVVPDPIVAPQPNNSEPTVSASETERNIDEDDEDPHTQDLLELNSPSQLDIGFDFEDLDEVFVLDNDLQGMSVIELGAEYEEVSSDLGDFRDFDDDYAAYAFDPDEVFEHDELAAAEPTDWFADRLSREDRALQKAAELIGTANWSVSALPLVQQIFVMSGWGATRLALEREIAKGLTPDELILAAHIKVIWAEHDRYWVSFDKTGSNRLSHQVLSWPTALLVVRSFESLPQMEEIEVLLEGLFASWYENIILRRAFKAFARYLWFRFSNLEGCLPANQPFDFGDPRELPAEEYSDLGLYDLLEIEKNEDLRTHGVFQTKHPLEPGCYFSDSPPVVEEQSPNGPSETEPHAATLCVSNEPVSEVEVEVEVEVNKESISNRIVVAPTWSAPSLTSALFSEASEPTYPNIEPNKGLAHEAT